jgi:hypothetical protein
VGSSVALGLLILALLVVFVWLAGRPRSPRADAEAARGPDVDDGALADAENEVQELDSFATPEDAEDQLPDWGPGAPK